MNRRRSPMNMQSEIQIHPKKKLDPLPPLPGHGSVDESLPVGPANDPVVFHAFPQMASPGDVYINPSNPDLAYLFTQREGWVSVNYDPSDY